MLNNGLVQFIYIIFITLHYLVQQEQLVSWLIWTFLDSEVQHAAKCLGTTWLADQPKIKWHIIYMYLCMYAKDILVYQI